MDRKWRTVRELLVDGVRNIEGAEPSDMSLNSLAACDRQHFSEYRGESDVNHNNVCPNNNSQKVMSQGGISITMLRFLEGQTKETKKPSPVLDQFI